MSVNDRTIDHNRAANANWYRCFIQTYLSLPGSSHNSTQYQDLRKTPSHPQTQVVSDRAF